ncbi:MFS transporter (plasmid) [Paraclostridium bifermentans]|uniref:MFS transporter n=1 Tax=Paraclostridium bifermentans TaxID=1490 RepID=A0A5P3XKD6_PARBF|nr:MFS transporter [Paraclostridium bifermentans]QEZ70827.1 MFS transporter [Paraclostridium bifermentans]
MNFQRGIFLIYLSQLGFNNTKIGVLQSILFASIFLFEIPTGVIGDKIGRKWSIVIGLMLLVLTGMSTVLFEQFSIFVLIFFVNGIANSFISGSGSALLYDSLKLCGKEDEYLKVRTNSYSISQLVLGISIFLGGYMQLISWKFVYFSYAGAMFLSALMTLFMYEDISNLKESTHENYSILKSSINFISSKKGRILVIFVVAYGIFEATMTPFYIYSQQLFSFYKITVKDISIIYAFIQFSSGFVVLTSTKIAKKYSLKNILTVNIFIISMLLLSNIFENKYWAVVIFIAIQIVSEVIFIIKDTYIQDRIESKIRATILSLISFVDTLFISFVYIVWGAGMDIIQVNYAIALLGILSLVSLGFFRCFFKNERN